MTALQERNEEAREEIREEARKCDEKTLSYLAGFFDGEGSVMVDRRKGRPERVNKNMHMTPTVTLKVCNTDPEPLFLFAEVFGGTVRVDDSVRSGRNKPLYNYRIHKNRSFVVLEMLLPYLRVKRSQAELALKVYEIQDRYDRHDMQESMSEVLPLLEQLAELNNRKHLQKDGRFIL